MFAGAAREAVFSRADVVARIRQDFVPVALKAALVNNPPAGAEGRLYREIGRSKPAPQGICVLDTEGKVLAWALSFDDAKSIGAFFEHARKRFRARRDGPVATERYMSYPGRRLADAADAADAGPLPPAPARHEHKTDCPAHPRRVKGTLVARVVGRTLDDAGALSADTVSQQSYVEDLFDIPPDLQAGLLRAIDGRDRARVPAAFARRIVTHAYLGELDVRPLDCPVPQHRTRRSDIEMWVERAGDLLRLEGTSDVSADGAAFEHAIRLRWRGFLKPDGSRIVAAVLTARGTERLRWERPAPMGDVELCARLPAGRAIDLDRAVRYGVVAEPVADGDATADALPDDVRRKLRELEQAVERLIRAGRKREALRLLEESLRRMRR